MAEIEIPQVNRPTETSLTRERNSLSEGIVRANSDQAPVEAGEFKGEINIRKPSKLERIKNAFISEDAKDIGHYIVWDVLIPGLRKTLRDIIVGSTDRVLLGTQTPPSSMYRERGVSYARYTNYSSPRPQIQVPERARPKHSDFGINDITFDYREDAESVVDWMLNRIETIGRVSVYNYFKRIGRTCDYTAQNWGWVTLSGVAVIQKVDGTYRIELPNPVPIYRA